MKELSQLGQRRSAITMLATNHCAESCGSHGWVLTHTNTPAVLSLLSMLRRQSGCGIYLVRNFLNCHLWLRTCARGICHHSRNIYPTFFFDISIFVLVSASGPQKMDNLAVDAPERSRLFRCSRHRGKQAFCTSATGARLVISQVGTKRK